MYSVNNFHLSAKELSWYHVKIMENENQNEPAQDADKLSNSYVSKKNNKAMHQTGRERSKKWRKSMSWGIPLLIILGIIVWLFTLPRKPKSPTVKGKNHIHATLAIMIDGVAVTIPGGIGLLPGGGTTHIPGAQQVIHTHVENDQLHIESVTGGALHEDDTKVSTFFRIWGKEFNSTTILDKTTVAGGTLVFKVNGVENTDFQNYQMRDLDKLEIIYTSNEAVAPSTTSTASSSSSYIQ